MHCYFIRKSSATLSSTKTRLVLPYFFRDASIQLKYQSGSSIFASGKTNLYLFPYKNGSFIVVVR